MPEKYFFSRIGGGKCPPVPPVSYAYGYNRTTNQRAKVMQRELQKLQFTWRTSVFAQLTLDPGRAVTMPGDDVTGAPVLTLAHARTVEAVTALQTDVPCTLRSLNGNTR